MFLYQSDQNPCFIKFICANLKTIAFLSITELQFALQSVGYLDRNPYRKMKTYIKYRKERTWIMLGFNFMVINHVNGDVHSKRHFNTHDFRVHSDKMIKYLSELPRKMIVLGVVYYSWTRYASPKLHQILVRFETLDDVTH